MYCDVRLPSPHTLTLALSPTAEPQRNAKLGPPRSFPHHACQPHKAARPQTQSTHNIHEAQHTATATATATMASPAPEAAHQNGISTPPANNATNTPPTQTQAPSFAAGVAGANGTGVDAAFAKKPRDARLVHLLLAQMGVHAYSERVPLQLLDFAYRYTSSILSDAQSYEVRLIPHPIPPYITLYSRTNRPTATSTNQHLHIHQKKARRPRRHRRRRPNPRRAPHSSRSALPRLNERVATQRIHG